jgi:hypothetical protein
MLKMNPLLIILCFSIVLISCQKEPELSQGNNGATGNTGGSGAAGASYYPLTKDTWWKYKDSLTGTVSDGKVLNRTKTIKGITYTAIVPATGTSQDTSWFAAPRPHYYITAKGVSPNGAMYDVLFHYLNDTASVGYSWRYNAGHGNGFTASIRTTILNKDMTMSVAGKNYTNVIQTRLELSYDVQGTEVDFGHYDYFTARGIGIIKIRSDLSMFGVSMVQTAADLIDYSVK